MTEIDRLILLNKKAYEKGYRGLAVVTPGSIQGGEDYLKRVVNAGAAVLEYWLRTQGFYLGIHPSKSNEKIVFWYSLLNGNTGETFWNIQEVHINNWCYEEAKLAGLEYIIDKL